MNDIEEALDSIAESLDPAVVVVTTVADGERAGCLVGFQSQSSIEPRRWTMWLSKVNHTYRVASRAAVLAVHFLGEDDHDLAEHFGGLSGDEVDKFAAIDVEDGPEGVPLLARVPHRIVLRRVALLDEGGDHVCVTGDPLAAAAPGPFRPLRLSMVQDISPGHEAEEIEATDAGDAGAGS